MSDRTILTVDEAIGVLADGETIHTYAAIGILIGADWTREAVISHIRGTGAAWLAGPMMTGMGHGLCVDPGRRLFAATDAGRLAALEAAIAAEPTEASS